MQRTTRNDGPDDASTGFEHAMSTLSGSMENWSDELLELSESVKEMEASTRKLAESQKETADYLHRAAQGLSTDDPSYVRRRDGDPSASADSFGAGRAVADD